MRVLVCGSRHFTDDDLFYEKLNEINDTYNFHNRISTIIHGGARGADSLADAFARDLQIPVLRFDALWELHGKSAGPIRNRRMLRESKPDLVVAFLAKDSRGTADMIQIAEEANIPVKVIKI